MWHFISEIRNEKELAQQSQKKVACANILGSEAVACVPRTEEGERAPEARPHSYSVVIRRIPVLIKEQWRIWSHDRRIMTLHFTKMTRAPLWKAEPTTAAKVSRVGLRFGGEWR